MSIRCWWRHQAIAWDRPVLEQEVKIVLRDGVEVSRITTFVALVQERTCPRCGTVQRRKLDS